MTDQTSDAPAETITATESQPAQAKAAPAVRGLRVEKIAVGATEVFSPMRDKVKLAGNLYLPEGEGPFPAIVTRTPYGKDTMELFSDQRAARKYTKAGYAYLVQDTRGKGRSEGHYAGFTDDRNDGYDTIEWMARQDWSNGKIGVTGASAGWAVLLGTTVTVGIAVHVLQQALKLAATTVPLTYKAAPLGLLVLMATPPLARMRITSLRSAKSVKSPAEVMALLTVMSPA